MIPLLIAAAAKTLLSKKSNDSSSQSGNSASSGNYESQMRTIDKKDMPNQGIKTWQHPQ